MNMVYTNDLKIFEGLETPIIEEILEKAKTETFQEGVVILSQWDESNGKAYIIIEWVVDVSISWKKVSELSVGDIFGEIALLSEEERIATVKAQSKVDVLSITQDTILTMVNDWNESINRGIMDRIEANLHLNEQ